MIPSLIQRLTFGQRVRVRLDSTTRLARTFLCVVILTPPAALFNFRVAEAQVDKSASDIESLKRAYAHDASDARVYLALIRTLLEARQIQKALSYERKPRPQKWDPKLEWQLGLAFLKAEQWEVAQRDLSEAARTDRDLGRQLAKLSEDAFAEEKYHEALLLAEESREYRPDSAPFHSMIGACLFHLRDPIKAVTEVQEAIRLDPHNEDYYIQLAQIFIDFNTPDAAVLLLEPSRSRFPSSSKIYFVLGVACMKSSQLRKAREYLQQSLAVGPQNPLPLHALAILYEGEKEWKQLSQVGRALEEFKTYAHEGFYYQAEAFYYLSPGDAEALSQVEGLLRKSINLRSDFSLSRLLLGRVLLDRGAYFKAIASLQRALALDPSLERAYYYLSIAYRKLGDEGRSSAALEKFRAATQQKRPGERSLQFDIVRNPPAKE